MRTRQSNHIEFCPFCGLQLKNRAAAVAHYRAHVRKGELIQRFESSTDFRLPELFLGKEIWWRMGMSKSDIKNPLTGEEQSVERSQRRFIEHHYQNLRRKHS